MDAGSQSDYLKLKVEVLPDRVRQVDYISIDGLHRPRNVTTDWFRERELGNGANGVVWLERATGGAVRAVKLLQKSKSVSNYLQELLAMTKLSRVIIHFDEAYDP